MEGPRNKVTKTEGQGVLEQKTGGLDVQASKMEDRRHRILMVDSGGSFDYMLLFRVSVPQFNRQSITLTLPVGGRPPHVVIGLVPSNRVEDTVSSIHISSAIEEASHR
jgi:hypothetical protein